MPTLHEGDCRAILPTLPAGSFDSAVTDAPYELGFMGREWDRTGIAFDASVWAGVLCVLKPGGYLLAFGGTRTYHRMTCAIEDAGFEIRDCLMWLYGTGFPKGQGCLKPGWEPIVLARKPGPRVLPLQVDACRRPLNGERPPAGTGDRSGAPVYAQDAWTKSYQHGGNVTPDAGRYPANVLHDGSEEVLEAFAAFGESTGVRPDMVRHNKQDTGAHGIYGRMKAVETPRYGDSGTAARFFYCAKASKSERGPDNTHPTVKPLAIMQWLVRLVTPVGGRVLDPFAGSGTTLLAAQAEGREAVGIELDAGHCEIVRARLNAARGC